LVDRRKFCRYGKSIAPAGFSYGRRRSIYRTRCGVIQTFSPIKEASFRSYNFVLCVLLLLIKLVTRRRGNPFALVRSRFFSSLSPSFSVILPSNKIKYNTNKNIIIYVHAIIFLRRSLYVEDSKEGESYKNNCENFILHTKLIDIIIYYIIMSLVRTELYFFTK